ncbi:TPA: hypothetical protein L4V00_001830 [Pseudomonas aeruginosa]|nr:hypothetical protein [Pseudomonas aeruginosa]HBO4704417.1 hypothetical protein [Pseudomonas aeruginosa]
MTVEERVVFIAGRLNFYKRNGVSFSGLTKLAYCIAADLTTHEAKTEMGRSPINHSTLMRRNGKYYQLLKSHLHEQSLAEGGDDFSALDPIAKRHVQLKDVELLRLRREVKRLQDKLCAYVSFGVPEISGVPYKYNYPEVNKGVSDSMGAVAKIFFDMLVDTEQFKFDQESGDLLHVGRSRRVALAARDMSCFLNWVENNKESRG